MIGYCALRLELYTHYLLGDRSLDTFKAFVLTERAQLGAIVVHD